MAWKNQHKLETLHTFKPGITKLTDVYQLVANRKESEEFYELEAGEVIDILLDEKDLPDLDNKPNYAMIGACKIRLLNSEQEYGYDDLDWVLPMDTNIKEYPIKGEYVVVATYADRIFYSQKLNLLASVGSNALPGLSQLYAKPTDDYEMEYYKENLDIRQLWPYEGDIMFNGRFGQGIRFGSNADDLTPNIKISVGHGDIPPEVSKPIVENINTDKSSLWMISNESIDFNPAHPLKATPDEFSGNQIFINTDRLVLNSKTQETLLYSAKGVHIGTPEITAKIGGKKDEHLVLGETLISLFEELLDTLMKNQIATGGGPAVFNTGTAFNPAYVASFKAKLKDMLTVE